MTLRVPPPKAVEVGMRSMSSPECQCPRRWTTVKGKGPREARRCWSRRAQEYEQSQFGRDLISSAEVVRDLHRGKAMDPAARQSYSEAPALRGRRRRLTRELAVVKGMDGGPAPQKRSCGG